MPRIAFILETFYADSIGGAERQVDILAQNLRMHSWQTAYIAQRDLPVVRSELIDGMEVVSMPLRKRRTAWMNFFHLKRAMQKCEADIFYQRVRHPYTGLSAYIAKGLGKPFIFAAASLADTIRKVDLRKTAQTGGMLAKVLHPAIRGIEDWGILNADEVILQTHEQQVALRQNYKREGVVIPNHLVMRDSSDECKQETPEVFWISNIKPFKRPELFINLAESCNDLDARFVMAGACPNQIIHRRIKEAEKALKNFHYIGQISPEEAELRIAGARILVNTSEFEGFPNTFQQAWMNGVPTLSLGVDPDGVINREALGVCTSSPHELESALRKVFLDEELRIQMGCRAKQYAAANYDIRKLTPRYIELFERVISR